MLITHNNFADSKWHVVTVEILKLTHTWIISQK